jgi:hypothetical protein
MSLCVFVVQTGLLPPSATAVAYEVLLPFDRQGILHRIEKAGPQRAGHSRQNATHALVGSEFLVDCGGCFVSSILGRFLGVAKRVLALAF